MAGTEKFRCRGVKREQADPTYGITTAMIQEYMQNRFDMLVANLRKNVEKYADLGDIKIKAATTGISNKFYPIFLIMPTEILEKHALMEDSSIPMAFYDHSDEEDETARLIPIFENFLKLYAYGESDIRMFENKEYLREINVNTNLMRRMKGFVKARMMKINKDKNHDDDENRDKCYVTIMLDPIRILHDMVVDEDNPKARFKITIVEVKKFKNGLYEYRFKKKFTGRGGNKEQQFSQVQKEIEAVLRS